jgi:Lactate racemase N-terminal domain
VKVPLLAGTRVVVVDAPSDAVILRPPKPGEGILDVGAAVRDALRFPLAGRPLEALATRGGRATIVVEPPHLPIPSSAHDPRQIAITATADELARAGVPLERQTILVAGGLQRRPGNRDLETLVEPEFARRFHGRVEVHDVERPDLVDLGSAGTTPLRVHPALVETELVVAVSAAETVLHGGPAALLAASGPEPLRAAQADSLLEPSASAGWDLAIRLERALAQRVPLIGVSLALDHPRLGGSLQGYPYEAQALERVAGSPLRNLFALMPAAVRAHVLRSVRCDVSAAAAFAGPPSVAHTEALLRAVEARSAVLDGRLDAVCIGIPRVTPYLPRERPNPLLAAVLGLALALRLWRDTFPLVDGGTVILLHRFHRRFAHPTQQPYRSFFGATRFGREPEELAEAERGAGGDARALEAYRNGRACHPLLPFADWAACAPTLSRVGAVLVAGCRDAVAARQLGFVPVHGVGPALAMARGRSDGAPRIGFLVSPPYFPLRVRSV